MKNTDDFSYLAFNNDSGAILAYGRTPFFALRQADYVAPDAPIRVIMAGETGAVLWQRHVGNIATDERKE